MVQEAVHAVKEAEAQAEAILREAQEQSEELVAKAKEEAQAAAALAHPNIVNVYDVGDEQNIKYIVMELAL